MAIPNPFRPRAADDNLIDEKELLSEIMSRADEVMKDDPSQMINDTDLTHRLTALRDTANNHIKEIERYLEEVAAAVETVRLKGESVIARKQRVVRMLEAALEADQEDFGEPIEPKLPLKGGKPAAE